MLPKVAMKNESVSPCVYTQNLFTCLSVEIFFYICLSCRVCTPEFSILLICAMLVCFYFYITQVIQLLFLLLPSLNQLLNSLVVLCFTFLIGSFSDHEACSSQTSFQSLSLTIVYRNCGLA